MIFFKEMDYIPYKSCLHIHSIQQTQLQNTVLGNINVDLRKLYLFYFSLIIEENQHSK